MFRNYLKVAFRQLSSNKGLAFINILGLSLGMTGAILLLLNIQFNLSTDDFHQHKEDLYIVYNKGVVGGSVQCWQQTPAAMAPVLKKEFPEVHDLARISYTAHGLTFKDKLIKANGFYTDSSFWRLFNFPLQQGETSTALSNPRGIVLTQQLARRLLGDSDPINKTIILNNADPMTVTGVLKDLPDNTQFHFEYLLPWAYCTAKGMDNTHWNDQNVTTYVRLQPSANIDAVNRRMTGFSASHSQQETRMDNFLYPLSQAYLRGRFQNGKPAGGVIDGIWFMSILTFIILLIAVINFMNLNTARSDRRAKEVGVRKVIGADRRSLVGQFIGEAILFAAIAGAISLLLIFQLLPTYNNLARVHVSINWASPLFWLCFIAFIVFTGFLAGSYPAFYLSSFEPSKVLKGVITNGKALITPRKILVVTQFALAIFLINFTLAFRRQVQYIQDRPVGYTRQRLMSVPMTDALSKNYPALQNALLQSGCVESTSQSNDLITQSNASITGLKWTGMDPNINPSFDFITSQGGFVKTNGLQLLTGRDIDVAAHPGDTLSCVINEAAARIMHVPNPLSMTLSDEGRSWTIVGVVKDFLNGDPNQETHPVLIRGEKGANYISIRLSANRPVEASLKTAETIIQQYNTGFPPEYRFADEDFEKKFRESVNSSRLINVFGLIAIFISCMGLLGLSIYMAETRVREVGIRKVLGASAASITTLLAKDFVRLILLAILLASPLAWLSINAFFHKFTYHTTPNIGWIFLSGFTALLIALVTISFHSIKAALANPIKSLRTE